MAHPVRPDSYIEINNFYTATVYEKGAEVVRMMQTLLGREGFRKGMELYFQRHDGQAVTCDDFAPRWPTPSRQRPRPAAAAVQALVLAGRHAAPTPAAATTHRAGPTPWASSSPARPRPAAAQDTAYDIPVAARPDRHGTAARCRCSSRTRPPSGATERLLVLDEPRHFFTFVNVDVEPVPSLLRGFSAPVCLADGLGDAELLVLMNHDTDPFNRWEAAQRLGLARLLARIRGEAAGALDAAYLDALRTVLRNPAWDASFKELVLTLPSEGYVAEQMDTNDPSRIHGARQAMKSELARTLRADWEWVFEHAPGGRRLFARSGLVGRRALANLALAMLCLDAVARGDEVWPGRAYQRFKDAVNMTDTQGALNALLASHSALAEPALQQVP